VSKRVLFAYNGRVEKDSNGAYYGNELNDTLVERYLTFGERVDFLVRIKKVTSNDKKSVMPFSHHALTIREVPDFASPVKFMKHIGQVKKNVREAVTDCDVVIARLPSFIGGLAIKQAVKLNKPYFVEVVGCPWDALWNHSTLGKLYAPFSYYALKQQVLKAPFVLYVTNEFLQKRYPTKGETVGITDTVLGSHSDDTLQKRLKKIEQIYDLNKPLLLGTAAGYDVRFKGQEYVIKSLNRLYERGIDCIYRPVGKGTGKRLQKIADSEGLSDKVQLIGQLKHSDVFNYLDQIDIYVQPSLQEGLPRAVVEAMSRGCVVIGSDTGGIPELLNESMIFKKGSVKELIEIIVSLDKQQMKKEAIRNFEFAKQFSKELMDKRRDEFYKKFIDEFQL